MVPALAHTLIALATLTRRRWRLFSLLALLIGLILPLPTHSDTLDCLDAARLTVGSLARIAFVPLPQRSVARALRDFPGSEAPVTLTVTPGVAVLVTRGPVCLPTKSDSTPSSTGRDYQFWWQVQTPAGQLGWLADTAPDSSGNDTIPALESWQALIDLVRPVPDGVAVLRVNSHGLARWLTGYATPLPIDGGQNQFPEAELSPLLAAFSQNQRQCPQIARIVDPASGLRMSAYPSPDSTRLLLVRHLWRTTVGCDGQQTVRYGIDRLSLIDPHGEQVEFDIPAHAPFVALAGDARRDVTPFSPTPNQIAAVVWSPDNRRAAVVLRYGPHFQLATLDTSDGTLTFIDDGFAPHWSPDGTRLIWLRADPDGQTVNLISAIPGSAALNAARQTLTLPAALWVVDAPLAPIWNTDGSRLAVCVQTDKCASVAVIDVPNRRTLAALPLPSGVFDARWALHDSALLWIAPDTLTLQPIARSPAQALPLNMSPGDQVTAAYLFPESAASTEHAAGLLVLSRADGSLRYEVIDLRTGVTGKVTFTS